MSDNTGPAGRGRRDRRRCAPGSFRSSGDDVLESDGTTDEPIDSNERFSTLYRTRRADIKWLCLSILHDETDADDAVQEAFAKAWHAICEGFSQDLYPWLRVVARNHCYDVLRKRGRSSPVDSPMLEAIGPSVDGSDWRLIEDVEADLVRQSVRRTSPSYQSILKLREGLSLSYQEIADRESLPLASVESRLYRARHALRKEFLALVGPEGFASAIWFRFRGRWFGAHVAISQGLTATAERLTPVSAAPVSAISGAIAASALAAAAAFVPAHVPQPKQHAIVAAPHIAVALPHVDVSTGARQQTQLFVHLESLGLAQLADKTLTSRRHRHHHHRQVTASAVLAESFGDLGTGSAPTGSSGSDGSSGTGSPDSGSSASGSLDSGSPDSESSGSGSPDSGSSGSDDSSTGTPSSDAAAPTPAASPTPVSPTVASKNTSISVPTTVPARATVVVKVVATTIVQASPSSNSTTTSASANFTDQLAVGSGSHGTVTYVEQSGSPLVVSKNGAVSTTGRLAAGVYVASGTDSDSAGDTGTWSYTLKVVATTIVQASPSSNSTTTSASANFTDQLAVGSGSHGTVTYVEQSGSPLVVSKNGAVSTMGRLAAGVYVASGTDSDSAGDTGTWSYTLKVVATTIVQASPSSNSTTTSASANFTDQLAVGSGSHGTVTYVEQSGSPLVVSKNGAVSTTGRLAAGVYVASGTDSDSAGDTGTWSYTLKVVATTIVQASPSSNSTTTSASANFTDQLAVGSGSHGTVTYVEQSGSPLVVSKNGAVSTTGRLAAGVYVASGTDSDSAGDTGTWSYTLKVVATTIVQASPSSNSTTTSASANFTDQLAVGSGSHGTVTYVEQSGSPLVVSKNGAVSTTGRLAAGVYVASGTDSDSAGDTGTWSYTLKVVATSGGSGGSLGGGGASSWGNQAE